MHRALKLLVIDMPKGSRLNSVNALIVQAIEEYLEKILASKNLSEYQASAGVTADGQKRLMGADVKKDLVITRKHILEMKSSCNNLYKSVSSIQALLDTLSRLVPPERISEDETVTEANAIIGAANETFSNAEDLVQKNERTRDRRRKSGSAA